MTDAHPDDELLSAFLDGDGPEAAAHLSGCGQCQARLADLRRAVALVAAPPPIDAGDRAARVAAAMAAADARSAATPPTARPSGTERRWAPILVAAAVAVLLGLAAIPLFGGSGGGDAGLVASPAEDRVLTEMEAAAVDGGDLGDQADALALGNRVRAVIEPGEAAGAAGAAAPSAGATASADMASEPTTTALAAGGGAAGTSKASGTGGTAASRSPCAATVRAEYGQGLGPLIYGATLRWQGRPAVALAYGLTNASGNLNHRIFVLTSDTCELLVVQAI